MPTDLGDVVADAASSLTKAAGDRGVRLNVDPAPAVVRADAARVRQVVTILVDNALRHTPRGGEVRVVVRADGSAATLDVEDDGPGIRDADMPHVFDRFWRAQGAPSGGTGLGLAIARTIVEQHGGRIMVSNGPSGGARFRGRAAAGRGRVGRLAASPVSPRSTRRGSHGATPAGAHGLCRDHGPRADRQVSGR